MPSLPEGLDPAFAAEFAQIRQGFLDRLPQRLQHIRAATHAQDLQMELHRLAGAAGGYGFAEIGECARAAMVAAQASAVAEFASDRPVQQALQALEDAISSALDSSR